MIRHYDMATGQPLSSERAPTEEASSAAPLPVGEPRLAELRESEDAGSRYRGPMPADMLGMDLARWLARHG